DAVIVRIRALHPRHKGDRQPCAQERILSVSLLATTPARVAEDVDIGSPEIEALEDIRVAGSLGQNVFDTPLDANRGRHLVDSGYVESRRQPDGLWKFGGPIDRDAVEGLTPPVIGGYSQARNRTRLVDELRGFFLERHAMHQIGCALFGRERCILVPVLCAGHTSKDQKSDACYES